MNKLSTAIAIAIEMGKLNRSTEDIASFLSDALDNVNVKVWREDETVKLPTYAKEGDACMDVFVH